MKCCFIIFVIIVTGTQTNGNVEPDAVPAELPEYGSYFVRGDVILAKKFWDGIRDHNQFVINDVLKDINDYADTLSISKPDHKTEIETLQKRNVDSIQSMADVLTQKYNLYGPVGAGRYLVVLNEIDEARRGKTAPDNKRCKPSVIKKWRDEAHVCLWDGMRRTKDIFHNLSDHLEDAYDNLVAASAVTKEAGVTDEAILQRLENATAVTENFVSDFKSEAKIELLGIWTSFADCNEVIQKEIKVDGSCD